MRRTIEQQSASLNKQRYNYITKRQNRQCAMMSSLYALLIKSLKMCLVLHILLCLQWCSICPCSILSIKLTVCQCHTNIWRQNTVTFLWKVPSKAATMITFPKLAISSQNSTVSGNYEQNTKTATTKHRFS